MHPEIYKFLPSIEIPNVAMTIAIVTLYINWIKWRREFFRVDDVLKWANEVITALQTIVLICDIDEQTKDREPVYSKLTEVIFSTSILIERGRMFFKNENVGDYGQEKELAYRGYRPMILDPIVVAHQIARVWGNADDNKRATLKRISLVCLKKFVSLAQKEVGRTRAANPDLRLGGDGIHLKHLIESRDVEEKWSRPN